MTEPAIDVSSYQGFVDWQAEKNAGVVLGCAKSSEGTDWTDPCFQSNWSEMARVGILRSAYHFGHPSNSPADEVNHFLATVGPITQNDILWLDIETNDGQQNAASWSYSFMSLLDCRVPNRKGIYTGTWFIDSNGGPSAWSACTKWALWLSKYTATISAGDCAPWTSCVLWQNTSSERTPGVHGVCDASIIANGGFFTASFNGKPTQKGALPVAQAGIEIILTHSGNGYWICDVDGGVFTYGDAQFFGSLGGKPLNAPIVSFNVMPNEDGYIMLGADNGVFNFGSAKYLGHPA